KEILRLLPNENLIYLGDTARIPYGTRGKETIKKFALELTDFILKQDIKFLAVACNTISSICLDDIQKISPVEVIGVIKPACKQIVEETKIKKVGVIGTNATINSRVYEKEINKIDPSVSVLSKATPLFVQVAEEGLGESKIA